MISASRGDPVAAVLVSGAAVNEPFPLPESAEWVRVRGGDRSTSGKPSSLKSPTPIADGFDVNLPRDSSSQVKRTFLSISQEHKKLAVLLRTVEQCRRSNDQSGAIVIEVCRQKPKGFPGDSERTGSWKLPSPLPNRRKTVLVAWFREQYPRGHPH